MSDKWPQSAPPDRKSTRLNSSHLVISYAVFCLKKTNRNDQLPIRKTQTALRGVALLPTDARRHGLHRRVHGPEGRVLAAQSGLFFFFFNDTATTEIYTLSLHDALPIYWMVQSPRKGFSVLLYLHRYTDRKSTRLNSSHLVISYAVFCLKKKKNTLTCTDTARARASAELIHLRHTDGAPIARRTWCERWSTSDRECISLIFFFFNDTATTEIYTLSLHDALPISIIEWRARGQSNCSRECPEQLD